MLYCEPSKADWKLYRELLPKWQEDYMAKLCDEYAAILTGKDRGSEAFRKIEKRIRNDKKRPGVMVEVKKSEMDITIFRLLHDKAIQIKDLEGFSDELKERIEYLKTHGGYA